MNKTLLLLLGTFIFSACTTNVRMPIMRPADVNVSKDIQSLILVNRFRPDPDKKGQKFWNVVEGIFSGEGINADRRGAEACIDGLYGVLVNSPRFDVSRPSIELKGSGRANFPEPLPPEVVKQICQDHGNADGLVTIEAFDSNTGMNFRTRTRTRTRNGNEYQEVTHIARGNVRVTVGWRFYSAQTGNLIDEFRMFETINFEGTGSNRALATSRLPNRNTVTQRVGAVTGDSYARRISPSRIWVHRHIYNSGCPEMRQAKRLGDVRDWEGAADIWKSLTNHPKRRIAKRATYNMAVACEIFGDLDCALDWAKQSYTLGNNQARNYHRTLLYRLDEEARLQYQLEQREEHTD